MDKRVIKIKKLYKLSYVNDKFEFLNVFYIESWRLDTGDLRTTNNTSIS